MVELVLMLAAVGLFEVLAARLGSDSRDGNDWITHRSV